MTLNKLKEQLKKEGVCKSLLTKYFTQNGKVELNPDAEGAIIIAEEAEQSLIDHVAEVVAKEAFEAVYEAINDLDYATSATDDISERFVEARKQFFGELQKEEIET
jgi:hypothetical protein